MDQEDVWDVIADDWREFRIRQESDVATFLEGVRGKILDLGCGNGRNFCKLPHAELYGVDFSQKMVELAHRFGYVEVTKAPSWDTRYENAFFDHIYLCKVLHCVDSSERRKKTLEEIHRLLKQGGTALVSVWGRGSSRVKNKSKECFVPWTVGTKKVQRYTYLYDLDELVSLCESVGFTVVEKREDENITLVLRKKR